MKNLFLVPLLFMFMVNIFLPTLKAQMSGEVVYKRTWVEDDKFYFDTLRFNGPELLYIEKRQKQQWRTPEGYVIYIPYANRLRYIHQPSKEYIDQQYNDKKKQYELKAAEAPKYEWTLQDEYKTIGNYKAQKATASVTFAEGDTGEAIAWFTTEIPVSGGPYFTWGLPGLIIEMTIKNHIKGKYTMESITMKPVGELKPKEGVWVQSDTGKDKGKLRDLLNKDGN